jgi:hypothetical protein
LRIKCIICGFKKRGSVRDEANYTVRTFMIWAFHLLSSTTPWVKISNICCWLLLSVKECMIPYSVMFWLLIGSVKSRYFQYVSSGGVKNFLLSTSSRLALGLTQPHIQWVLGALSPGVKRPGREADHSPSTSAEVKKMWIYTCTPHMHSWRNA